MVRIALLLFCVLVGAVGALKLLASSPPTPEDADRDYGEKSYARALDAYRAVLAANAGHPERTRIELQIARSLIRLEKWSEALSALAAYLKVHTDDIWAARAHHELGNLYRQMPGWGSKKDDTFYPAETVPGGEYVDAREENVTNARTHLETARRLYDNFLSSKEPPLDRPTLATEAIQVELDLADFLQQRHGPIILGRAEAERKQYDPQWPDRDKVLFLYEEIERLDPAPDRSLSAKARYLKALYLLAPHRYEHPSEGRELTSEEEETLTAQAVTRDRLAAEKLLRSVVTDFPKDELADEAQFRLALLLEEDSRFTEAIGEFGRLITLFPQSPWTSDAQAHIQDIAWPVLSVDADGTRPAGEKPKVALQTRNIKTVTFAVSRLDLAGLIAGPGSRQGHVHWSSLEQLAGQRGGKVGLGKYRGEEVARWEHETGDEGKHLPYSAEVEVPVTETGAYLLRASAPGREAAAILLLSDLAVVHKTDRTRSLLFVTDARTGEPVAGAQVLWRFQRQRGNSTVVKAPSATTEETGLAVINLPAGGPWDLTQAFVAKGNRLALVGAGWFQPRVEEEDYTIYVYTDRPVYRPDKSMHFKVALRQLKEGQYENAPNTALTASIRDPQGNELKRFDLVTSDQGTASGEFHLAEEPPLGLYSVSVEPLEGTYRAQTAHFRVEEYKKPEFEVTVKADSPLLKVGGRARVTVAASYYFGGPVPEATVKYRVERARFWHWYQEPEPFGWLYGGEESRPYPYGAQELVTSGEATTDAEGKATIEFDTPPVEPAKDEAPKALPGGRQAIPPPHPKEPTNDWRYTVSVDVTDKSRRTISGEGAVLATEKGFYAYVLPRRGFYRPGDTVEVEVRTLTPGNDPVKASGTLTVYRVKYQGPRNEERVEEKLLAEPLASDAEGRAFFKWTPDEEGLFKVAFTAADAWGGTVEGATDLWVAGPNFRGGEFRFADLDILTDKRTYQKGEVAHVLLSSNFPDSYVLLSEAADDEILSYEVLHIEGKTRVFDLPLTERHVPNFFLAAEMVREGQPFLAQHELFVPPVEKMLTVEVKTDKPEYRPRDVATFTLDTHDYQGNPVATELSLSVFDKAILYIQPDMTPDVRQFFFGRRRTYNLGLASWLQVTFSPALWEAEKRKEFPTHPWPPEWEQWAGGGFVAGTALRMAPSAPAAAAPTEAVDYSVAPEAKGEGAEAEALVTPEVRMDFRDSAYWSPLVETSDQGTASVEVPLPDSLTTWVASARGLTADTRVGQAESEVTVTKNLLVRLEAPRFFVERDEVLLSGIVHNRLASAKKVRCRLQVGEPELKLAGNAEQDVEVPAGGEKRVDWTVLAQKEGTAEVTVSALTDEESDAVKMSFPVFVHGIEKFTAQAGQLKGDGTATLEFTVPRERKPGSAQLELVLSPSVVSALIEALPYLADYPYGCTEQTMSRFLPAVVVADTLKQLGLSLEDLGRQRRSEQAQRLADKAGIFSSRELFKRVQASLKRLYDFQGASGGWGWWKEGDASPYMTAYVVYGLLVAQRAGCKVDAGRLDHALRYLEEEAKALTEVHLKAYVGYVLGLADRLKADQLDDVYAKRDDLNDYSRALLALAYQRLGVKDRAQVLCRNLENFVVVDEKAETAHWGSRPGSFWWYWYNDDVETTAWALRALTAVTPGNPLAPRAAKWLLANRTGNRWKSTKDTAHAVYALAEYARTAGELEPNYTLTIAAGGGATRRLRITRENMFSFDSDILVGDEELGSGARTLTITKEGPGTLYFSAYLRYFTLEEDIKGDGNEIAVSRTYYRLHPKTVTRKEEGREFPQLTYDREALPYQAEVAGGDLLEVELRIQAANNYEYLVFEDRKPAGCEPVEVRSGYRWGDGLCSNTELRDEKVVFFADALRQGEHLLRYKLWAEIPGRLHVLPTRAYAMYAPKVRATSDEMRLTISERKASAP